MRLGPAASCLFVLLPACAVPARFIDPRTASERTIQQVARDLADASVVFLGETHDNKDVHAAHLALVQELWKLHPALAISMEMFERDVQPVLFQYLLGDIDEAEFLRDSRPWGSYATDYRPLVEWARANHVPVIAANVPRPLAAKVSREGLPAVQGEAYAAREVHASDDQEFAAFKVEMGEHAGSKDNGESMRRYYEAQCLKDDTMAESIVDFLREERGQGRATMVVHVCGRMHSDYRRGTVARVALRQPDWKLRVLSVDEVQDPRRDLFHAAAGIADYVILVPKPERQEMPAHKPDAAAASPHQAKPQAPPPVHAPVADGGRPALGVHIDYGAGSGGLRVETVSEGGPAAAAGIKDGDLIVNLAGNAIDDVEGYAQVLDTLRIGTTVDVVVKRGDETVKLKVKVGSR